MKKIFIILTILIIILLALIIYQKSNVKNEDGIKITYKDTETILTFSKIRSYEEVSFSINRDDKFNGYDFSDILKSLKIPTNNETKYILQSKDGGTLNLSKKENETLYLVFQEDATGQFIRLIIPSDEFSQRWMKYLTAIEIK